MQLSFNHVAFHVAVALYCTPPPLWLADSCGGGLSLSFGRIVQRECCMSVDKVSISWDGLDSSSSLCVSQQFLCTPQSSFLQGWNVPVCLFWGRGLINLHTSISNIHVCVIMCMCVYLWKYCLPFIPSKINNNNNRIILVLLKEIYFH